MCFLFLSCFGFLFSLLLRILDQAVQLTKDVRVSHFAAHRQMVLRGDDWKFDGPVGLLLPDGEVLPMEELPDDVAAPDPE